MTSQARTSSTKADEIALALEERIALGELAPGTLLRQDQLAIEFRSSRTPVREALRRVAARGLASFTPNRGVRVTSLDTDRWEEVYCTRAVLEGLAAELAAPRITRAELAALAQADAEYARITRRLQGPLSHSQRTATSVAWVRANYVFHDRILDAARAPLVAELARGFRRTVTGQRLWAPGTELARMHAATAGEHAAIREALEARSGRAARALAREHVMNSWRIVEVALAIGEERRAPPAGVGVFETHNRGAHIDGTR